MSKKCQSKSRLTLRTTDQGVHWWRRLATIGHYCSLTSHDKVNEKGISGRMMGETKNGRATSFERWGFYSIFWSDHKLRSSVTVWQSLCSAALVDDDGQLRRHRSAANKFAEGDASTSLHRFFVPAFYCCSISSMLILSSLPMAFLVTSTAWRWMNGICHDIHRKTIIPGYLPLLNNLTVILFPLCSGSQERMGSIRKRQTVREGIFNSKCECFPVMRRCRHANSPPLAILKSTTPPPARVRSQPLSLLWWILPPARTYPQNPNTRKFLLS